MVFMSKNYSGKIQIQTGKKKRKTIATRCNERMEKKMNQRVITCFDA